MPQPSSVRYAIGIPAKNEALRIERCLSAFDRQQEMLLNDMSVTLLVNNSSDETAAIARRLAPLLRFTLTVLECDLPPARGHAGAARKMAMDLAYLTLTDPTDGIVLTTDADSAVAPDWLARNIAALRRADAVAGNVDYDLDATAPDDPICVVKRLEARYEAMLAEIDALIDPVPHDPWPRHRMQSGASLALHGRAYLHIGGLPVAASGEDHALCEAIEAAGLRLRHAPDVRVETSVRLYGRARGGAADFLRIRHGFGNDRCGAGMIQVDRAASIASLRRWTREALKSAEMTGDQIDRMLGLAAGTGEQMLNLPGFGAAWQLAAQSSVKLLARPVTLAELPAQMQRGRELLVYLHRCADLKKACATDRSDRTPSSAARQARGDLQAAE